MLRRLTPAVLLCGEAQRLSFSEWTAAEFDAVVVKKSSASTQLVIATAVGCWWRRQLGATLRNLGGEKTALSLKVLALIFDSTTIPADCATIARSVDVSSEHLSRVMPRTLGNAWLTPKVLLDFAVTIELFVRLGIGCDWDSVASDLWVSTRTLNRALSRTNVMLGTDVRDFRALIKSIEGRRWLGGREDRSKVGTVA